MMLSSGSRSPALLVDAGEHQAEQVGVVGRVAEPAPVRHQTLDQIDLKLLVLLGLSPGLDPQLALDRQLLGLLLPLREAAHHGGDERVRGVPVERVEPVVEPAERDGVQGQRGHVLRDVDLVVRIEPGPLVHQLPGDVHHPRQVAAHRLLAERRHQDVVRAAPHRVGGLAGEQTLAGLAVLPDLQAGAELLAEPGVVADLLDQVGAGDDDAIVARHLEPEDRAVLPAPLDELLHRVGGVQIEQIPEERHAVRARELVDGDGSRQGSLASVRGRPDPPRPATLLSNGDRRPKRAQ